MLAWLIPPEMSPMVIRYTTYIIPYNKPINADTSRRAKVNSVSVSVNNIAGLVVAEVSPIALGAIGFKFFYVYVACNIVGAMFYYFFLPEYVTCGRIVVNDLLTFSRTGPRNSRLKTWIFNLEIRLLLKGRTSKTTEIRSLWPMKRMLECSQFLVYLRQSAA